MPFALLFNKYTNSFHNTDVVVSLQYTTRYDARNKYLNLMPDKLPHEVGNVAFSIKLVV